MSDPAPTTSLHLSALEFDLLALNALDAHRKRLLEEHLQHCSGCAQEKEALSRFHAEFSEAILSGSLPLPCDRVDD